MYFKTTSVQSLSKLINAALQLTVLLLLLLFPNPAFTQNNTPDTVAGMRAKIFREDVIINGLRMRENTPMTYTTISKEELQKTNLGQDIPYLLDGAPSVVTTSDAGAGVGYTYIKIRGVDATRINVTLNGVPVNDAESQGVYWVDLPDLASSVDNLQIQRGAGSSTNGAGAFGAAINIKTNTPSILPYLEINNSFGSFNTWKHTVKASSGLIKKHYFIEGRVSEISSDGYIERARSKLWSYNVSMGYQSDKTLVKAIVMTGKEVTFQTWYGIPEDSVKTHRRLNIGGTDYLQKNPAYDNEVDNYRQNYFQLFLTQKLRSNWYMNLGLFTTLGKGYYEQYKVLAPLSDYAVQAPVVNGDSLFNADLIRRRWLDNIFYGGIFSFNYENTKGLNLTFGGLLSNYRGKHYGNVIWARDVPNVNTETHYYNNRGIKRDFNVYAKLSYTISKIVTLHGDLQYRYVNHNINGGDSGIPLTINDVWHFFNPKAGIFVNANKYNAIYASYGYLNHEPGGDDLEASTKLQPVYAEKMHDVEVGYQFKHRQFPFSINYFYMNYDNQLVMSGKLNKEGNPIEVNVKNSYRTGVELQGGFNFYKRSVDKMKVLDADAMSIKRLVFAIRYNFTGSSNKIKDVNEYTYTYDPNYILIDSLTLIRNHKNVAISFSPNYIAFLEFIAYPVKGLELSLTNKAISRQFLDNTQSADRMIQPYYYSNFRLTYSFKTSLLKDVQLSFMLNNIFNHLFVSNGYTYSERYTSTDANNQLQITAPKYYNYYFPQAGINFLVGVGIKL